MRLTYIFVSACFAGVLIGCSQPSEDTAKTGPDTKTTTPPPSSSTAPNSSNNNAAKATPTTEKPSVSQPGSVGDGKTLPPSTSPSTDASKPSATDAKGPASIPANDLNWHPSQMSALEVAKETDDMIQSLKNVQADIQYSMNMAAGKTTGHLVEKIKDANNFMLQYPTLVNDKKYGVIPSLTFGQGDGKQIKEKTEKLFKSRSISVVGKTPDNLAASWPLIGNREIFAGLLDKRKPFENYIQALSNPKAGYKTTVTERQFKYQGRTYRQLQITSVQPGNEPQINGSNSVSMIFDANIHLPLTIKVVSLRPGDSRANTLDWSAKWHNNVKFQPSDFRPLQPAPPEKKSTPAPKARGV